MCSDGGGVWSLLFQLAVGSSAMHEVSHDPLFSAKLIRLAGEVMQVFSSDVGDGGSDPPCEDCGGGCSFPRANPKFHPASQMQLPTPQGFSQAQ